MEHAFNTNVAVQFDVNIAIILHQFAKSHAFSPRTSNQSVWIEIVSEYLHDLFGFWPSKKINSLVNKLIKLELLERKPNTLCWYALATNALAFYPSLQRKF